MDHLIELPGIYRIGLEEIARGLIWTHPVGEPCWFDQILYDIPQTLESAALQMIFRGAKAITIYEPLVRLRKYDKLIQICEEAELIIVVAGDDFQRRVWWHPESK